ncbi:MAG: UDP-N-acetyl-D-mannosamine dehydrogenase [Sphingomonadaceae bacterium]
MSLEQRAPSVVMIGLGYIGLPTAAVIARTGLRVTGVDVAQDVVDSVNRGEIHIEENGLEELVRGVVGSGNLVAQTEPPRADIYLIAVPTPFDESHAPDIQYVLKAGRAIAPVLSKGAIVILESTSPVGTTKRLRDLLASERPDLSFPEAGGLRHDVQIAYCPERVLPGNILQELIANDRVIGGLSEDCATRAKAFYEQFIEGKCILTDASSAEMTKLAENAFRDVNIAFANELANVAERLDLDVWEVIRLANRHPRVNILNPGPGVGGHCIAVDPWFIVHSAPQDTRLIRTARQVNDGRMERVVYRVMALAEEDDAPIACFGLAFKANIDDMRESPALAIAEQLVEKYGSRIRICEPYIDTLPKWIAAHGATLVPLEEALKCEILVVLVDHDVFKSVPGYAREGKKVIDTRGIWRD